MLPLELASDSAPLRTAFVYLVRLSLKQRRVCVGQHVWVVYTAVPVTNTPRSCFLNRASFPLAAISRMMAA